MHLRHPSRNRPSILELAPAGLPPRNKLYPLPETPVGRQRGCSAAPTAGRRLSSLASPSSTGCAFARSAMGFHRGIAYVILACRRRFRSASRVGRGLCARRPAASSLDGKTARGRAIAAAASPRCTWSVLGAAATGWFWGKRRRGEVQRDPAAGVAGTQRLHRDHRRHGLPDQDCRTNPRPRWRLRARAQRNQGTLHDEVEDFFATARAGALPMSLMITSRKTTKITGVWKCAGTGSPKNSARCPKPVGVHCEHRIGECWSAMSIRSNSACSELHRVDAKRFAHRPLGLENRLHWRLDVVFNRCEPHRTGNAPAIMTAIRHLC